MSVRLTEAPFDPGALLTAFSGGRSETGAVATFTGLARAEQGSTAVLELEAYPGFTESEIARIVEAARARFALDDVAVLHRIGRVAPGVQVALDQAIVRGDAALPPSAEVAFLPPMSGG